MSEGLKSWQLASPYCGAQLVVDNRCNRQRSRTVTSSPGQRGQVPRAGGDRTMSTCSGGDGDWRKVEHRGFGVCSWQTCIFSKGCCQCRVPKHLRHRWSRVTPTFGQALMGQRPISPICAGPSDTVDLRQKSREVHQDLHNDGHPLRQKKLFETTIETEATSKQKPQSCEGQQEQHSWCLSFWEVACAESDCRTTRKADVRNMKCQSFPVIQDKPELFSSSQDTPE